MSLARIPLSAAFALGLGHGRWPVVVLAAAGLTDVLDGWYARRFRQVTRTGALVDAVTDKIFVAAVVIALVLAGMLSVADALLLGARDVGELVIAAALAAHASKRLFGAHPHHTLGKATTLLQFGVVLAALFGAPRAVVHALALGTAAAGALATAAYVEQERVLPRS